MSSLYLGQPCLCSLGNRAHVLQYWASDWRAILPHPTSQPGTPANKHLKCQKQLMYCHRCFAFMQWNSHSHVIITLAYSYRLASEITKLDDYGDFEKNLIVEQVAIHTSLLLYAHTHTHTHTHTCWTLYARTHTNIPTHWILTYMCLLVVCVFKLRSHSIWYRVLL